MTPAELEALHLVAVEGLTLKEAGDRLGLGVMGVNKRLRGMRSKLGARNSLQATVLAFRKGLIA